MLIRTGFEISFDLPAPTAMLLALYVHPDRAKDVRGEETLTFSPHVECHDFIDTFGNRVGRILAPAGPITIRNDIFVQDTGLPDPVVPDAKQIPVAELPDDVIPFLLASRYCEVDRLSQFAWDTFGNTPLGWPRVQAVCDFVHNHITFGYQHARPTKSAFDVYTEKLGVCRDFMHLSVTLLRCLNIPARYATGYLGDIGIPALPYPMDFSAWFEVYLDHQWFTFDARHNVPRIARILMARGRDATDVALTTSFGPSKLTGFKVWTDEIVEIA